MCKEIKGLVFALLLANLLLEEQRLVFALLLANLLLEDLLLEERF